MDVSKLTIDAHLDLINVSKTFSNNEKGFVPLLAWAKKHGKVSDLTKAQPIIHGKILDWDNATINLAVRGEYVEWNGDKFAATGLREYNDLKSIMPAISFRPTPQTVLRLNYRFQTSRDITGNTIGAALGPTRGVSFGIATYF